MSTAGGASAAPDEGSLDLLPTLALMQYRKVRRTQSGRVGNKHEFGDASIVWTIAMLPALLWAAWASVIKEGYVSSHKAVSVLAVAIGVSVLLSAVGPLTRWVLLWPCLAAVVFVVFELNDEISTSLVLAVVVALVVATVLLQLVWRELYPRLIVSTAQRSSTARLFWRVRDAAGEACDDDDDVSCLHGGDVGGSSAGGGGGGGGGVALALSYAPPLDWGKWYRGGCRCCERSTARYSTKLNHTQKGDKDLALCEIINYIGRFLPII